MNSKLLILFAFIVQLFATNLFASPWKNIHSLGFSPTYLDAPNFSLQDLSGTKHDLNDYKGNWILLNFWATWCGPCRTEMPTLEGLHQEMKGKPLHIIGVSIDQGNTRTVKQYIRKQSITFTILHDKSGATSGAYKASSVPSVYLISPDQKLVGIYRGATDWDTKSVLKNIEELISNNEILPPEKEDIKVANIPEKLIPPKLMVELIPKNPKEGDLLKLLVHIIWKGPTDRYLVKVPKIEHSSNIEFGSVGSFSKASAEQAKLTYSFPFKISGEIPREIGPITMEFKSIMGGKEQFSRHPKIELKIEKSKSVFSWYLIFSVMIVLVIIVSIFSFLAIKKNKKKNNENDNIINVDELSDELNLIRSLKMSGKCQEYQEKLISFYKKILQSSGQKEEKIDILLEEVSFAGRSISNQEALTIEKKIENYISPCVDED